MNTSESLAREAHRGQYRFGEFVLDLEGGFLRRNGDEISLRPKVFEALCYLVSRHGKLVSKDQLAQAVWSDVAVTDNSLAQCLAEIRRALGDDDQRLIRTVARRGYVFDGPVTMVFPTADPVRPQSDLTAVSVAPEEPAHRTPRVGGRPGRLALILLAVLTAVGGAWQMLRSSGTKPGEEAPVQLTEFNDSAVSPSLSHDGRVLTFVRGGFFGTVGAVNGQVYVKLLGGGAPVQLTRDPMNKINPVFSPDDSRIIYTTLLPGLSWDSWQVPVLGGSPQPFLSNASGLQWLDSRRLVYAAIKTGNHMGIATSTESRDDYREIYFPAHQNGMAHRVAPSPDRKWLLVEEMSAGTWLPCRLMPLDGSSAGISVSPPRAQCTTAGWSPDGQWMYFSSNAGGAFHLWRQRFPDGTPEQITFGPTEQEGTAILPDGRHLITSMGLRQTSVWLHDARGDRRLTDEGLVAQPILSTSGTTLFYLVRTQASVGQASGELWQLDIATGNRRQVLPEVVVANYSVSPDERALLYSPTGPNGSDGVWIVDLERRQPPRQLVRGTELRAFFGAPGEIVYAGEDSRLYRMKADGSMTERISDDPVAYLVSVSPDGRWAQAVLPRPASGHGTTSLWFVSLRHEQSFEVCNASCSVGPRSFLVTAPFEWSRNGRWLFVNLSHFGQHTPQTVVLPYRADAPPQALWPAGLASEELLMRNPGARLIKQTSTKPGAGTDDYVYLQGGFQSNLYRIPIPD